MTLRNQHTYLWGSTLQPLKKMGIWTNQNPDKQQAWGDEHMVQLYFHCGHCLLHVPILYCILFISILFPIIVDCCLYITMISRIALNDVSDYYKHPTICHINTMPGLPLMSRLFPMISPSYYNMFHSMLIQTSMNIN